METHLNGHVLAVLDVETTGFTPGVHEIIEVCIMPLDIQLNPHPDIRPFIMEIAPERVQEIDFEALRIQKKDQDVLVKTKMCGSKARIMEIALNGPSAYTAQTLLLEWFDSLHLGTFKKLMPIALNYVFDRAFIMEWLGDRAFHHVFNPQYREIMSMAALINDMHAFRGKEIPFKKLNLTAMCTALEIEYENAHTAVADVMVTGMVYKALVERYNII